MAHDTTPSPSSPPPRGSGRAGGAIVDAPYWFEEPDSAVTVLQALRNAHEADRQMRRRMSTGMSINTTDLEAIRHAIAHERLGDPLTPKALARLLGISGASTSKLIDRLTRSHHLIRDAHPRDRRSVIILATDHAHEQVREHLSDMHERMLAVANSLPEASRADTTEFLQAMADCLWTESGPH